MLRIALKVSRHVPERGWRALSSGSTRPSVSRRAERWAVMFLSRCARRTMLRVDRVVKVCKRTSRGSSWALRHGRPRECRYASSPECINRRVRIVRVGRRLPALLTRHGRATSLICVKGTTIPRGAGDEWLAVKSRRSTRICCILKRWSDCTSLSRLGRLLEIPTRRIGGVSRGRGILAEDRKTVCHVRTRPTVGVCFILGSDRGLVESARRLLCPTRAGLGHETIV